MTQIKDSLSFLYVEHAIIEQHDFAIMLIDKNGQTPVPIASIAVLLLGPGTNITHAAIRAIHDNGAAVVWVGEQATAFYGFGVGQCSSGANAILQAKLVSDPDLRMEVVRNVYAFRFPRMSTASLTLEQVRGLEGVRMREIYKFHSKISGVPWRGRKYRVGECENSDVVNQALTIANHCLYGVCHSAILALGYVPALGFIHTGRILSFVYDVADLYKHEVSIPAAFEVAKLDLKEKEENVSRQARKITRKYMRKTKLLAHIADDLKRIFAVEESEKVRRSIAETGLWDGEDRVVAQGINHANSDVTQELIINEDEWEWLEESLDGSD